MTSLSLLLLLCMLFSLLCLSVSFTIDDENPSEEHFCTLDPTTREPINCDVDGDDGDSVLQSRVKCDGVELGALGTSCELRNLCYDARGSRAYVKTGYGEPVTFYQGAFDFVLLDAHATLPLGDGMPNVSLLGYRSNENMFSANVSREVLQRRDVQWLDGDVLLVFRQYLSNYYHIIMDDMIAMWWTLVHHHPLSAASGSPPRNLQIVVLDDNDDSAIDTRAMFAALSNKPVLTRRQLHERGALVCMRRAIVGAAERSYGGPGRRFITDPLLRQFHQHIRTGAYAAIAGGATGAPPEALEPVKPTRARLALLYRKGQRVVLNEADVTQGLRAAFPDADVFEFRPDDMSFGEQVAAMRNTTLLLGVHGAGLTNLLFLPPGAAVVEIMPWHWERRAYERMAHILGFTYAKWDNTDRAATVFPEETTWKHFPAVSEEDRNFIRNADSKPMEMRGMAGLAAEKYWINQDTRVNVAEFVAVVRKALLESSVNAPFFRQQQQQQQQGQRRDEL